MKKIFYAVLAVVAMAFVGCKDTQTPETDTTKLWPAASPSGDAYGYIDAKGNFVIAPLFKYAGGFSCGYALVVMDNEIKFIDKNGAIQATPFSFDMTEDNEAYEFYYNYSTLLTQDFFFYVSVRLSYTLGNIFNLSAIHLS